MLDLASMVGGGVLLYFGAEWLVGGAAGIARSLGVSALLVGLTVVAYGTSMPEVVVGVAAAADGHPEIALGNVLGSNVANLGLILGLTALVRPTPVSRVLRTRELPVLILATLSVPVLLLDGRVGRWEGAALLTLALVYTYVMIRGSRAAAARAPEAAKATAEAADVAGAPAAAAAEGRRATLRLGMLALVGLFALVLGGHVFVSGATGVARAAGISERVVGLTIVAVGTSIPELATSVIAAWRGHAEIAVGNVVGSNIFNVLLCLGSAAMVGEVGAPLGAVALDAGAMIALTLVGAFLLRTERRVTRVEGAFLIALYATFVAVVTLVTPPG